MCDCGGKCATKRCPCKSERKKCTKKNCGCNHNICNNLWGNHGAGDKVTDKTDTDKKTAKGTPKKAVKETDKKPAKGTDKKAPKGSDKKTPKKEAKVSDKKPTKVTTKAKKHQSKGSEVDALAVAFDKALTIDSKPIRSPKKTRPQATACLSHCDHPGRTYLHKSMPCNQQHHRRTSTKLGGGEINDPEVRAKVLAMNGSKCIMGPKYNEKCVVQLTHKTLEIDHAHPFSRGGYDGLPNWVPICRSCNAKKNNKALANECRGANGEWLCSLPDSTKQGYSTRVSIVLSDEELDLTLRRSKRRCVVKFFSSTCGPCQRAKKPFSKAAARDPKSRFIAADADKCPRFFFQVLGCSAVPVYFLFMDGKFQEIDQPFEPD